MLEESKSGNARVSAAGVRVHGRLSAGTRHGFILMLPVFRNEFPPPHMLVCRRRAAQVVGLFGVVLMVFFLTCAGPYGIEPTVAAAGPLVVIIGGRLRGCAPGAPPTARTARCRVLRDADNLGDSHRVLHGGDVLHVRREWGLRAVD